jgi:hypothetical protein
MFISTSNHSASSYKTLAYLFLRSALYLSIRKKQEEIAQPFAIHDEGDGNPHSHIIQPNCGRLLISPTKQKNGSPQHSFMLKRAVFAHSVLISPTPSSFYSPLSPVQRRHGGNGRDPHGADIHAGESFGASQRKVFPIQPANLASLLLIAGGDQIAVVGKERPEEGCSVDIVRAHLQTQPAFQTFSGRVLVTVVVFGGWLIVPNEQIGLLEVLLDDGTVNYKITDNWELAQRKK